LTIKFSQDKKAANSIVKEHRNLFQPQTLGGISILFWWLKKFGGADRNRTGDLRRAKPALSQLSYSPKNFSAEKFLKNWWA
jgi:hypothetical protein